MGQELEQLVAMFEVGYRRVPRSHMDERIFLLGFLVKAVREMGYEGDIGPLLPPKMKDLVQADFATYQKRIIEETARLENIKKLGGELFQEHTTYTREEVDNRLRERGIFPESGLAAHIKKNFMGGRGSTYARTPVDRFLSKLEGYKPVDRDDITARLGIGDRNVVFNILRAEAESEGSILTTITEGNYTIFLARNELTTEQIVAVLSRFTRKNGASDEKPLTIDDIAARTGYKREWLETAMKGLNLGEAAQLDAYLTEHYLLPGRLDVLKERLATKEGSPYKSTIVSVARDVAAKNSDLLPNLGGQRLNTVLAYKKAEEDRVVAEIDSWLK